MQATRSFRTVLAVGLASVGGLVAAAPAHSLKVKYVAANTPASADSIATIDAQCPDGFKVTGGGAFSSGAYQETKIQDSFPVDGDDGDNKNDDA